MILVKNNLSLDEEIKLMDIYLESNKENIKNFYPECKNEKIGLEMIKEDFCKYIKEEFFINKDNKYYILEKDNLWVSAMRISKIQDFYWIEALETHPMYRNKGYAKELLIGSINCLKQKGNFIIRDEVYKENIASLNTHLKCGFIIEYENSKDYFSNTFKNKYYGLKYEYKKH